MSEVVGGRRRVAGGLAPARYAVLSPYAATWLAGWLTAHGFSGATVRAHAQWLRENGERDLAGQVEMGWAQLQETAVEWRETPAARRRSRRPASVDGNDRAEIEAAGAGSVVSAEITTQEAAEMLNMTTRRVGQMLAAGSLSGRKVGRSWLVDRASVVTMRDVRAAS